MLNESDLERYASQLIMPEIEEEGQSILLKSKILIIGAGGLGNPTAIFCSAAGIGNIDICDHDNIELSNLNRQIAFTIKNLGLSKSIKLRDYCLNLNPNLKINSIVDSFDNKFPVDNYDIILDCSDNIKTKYMANILAHKYNKTLITASATQFEGQLAVFKSGKFKNLPCYECIFPVSSEVRDASCGAFGVLSTAVGTIGLLQANETIKILTNTRGTTNQLVLFDASSLHLETINVKKRNDCPVCNIT